MNDQPSILFISPVVPAPTGNGLAMRAAAMIEALSKSASVYLICPGATTDTPPASCEEWFPIPAPRSRGRFWWMPRLSWTPPEWADPSAALVQQIQTWIGDRTFSFVHVFRLYMLPLAQTILDDRTENRPKLQLDLDDLESEARLGMVPYMSSPLERRMLEKTSRFYARQEAELLPKCDVVYVCNALDRDLLQERGVNDVRVLPNTVAAGTCYPLPEPSEPFTFLFVGNLNHFPNIDGLNYLITDLLPVLRRTTTVPFRVHIVGSGELPRQLTRGGMTPELKWIGSVEDIQTAYEQVHATLVPLRCGGGTRIKILESFAFGRPVLSTPAGARGLEVESGNELLLAADPESFAQACVALMSSPGLRTELTTRAGTWVREYASPELLTRLLATEIREEESSRIVFNG